MLFAAWKARINNYCEGKAQEERKEEREEGRHESEGSLVQTTDTKTRLDDPTNVTEYFFPRLASRQDRRLSTTSSANNALVLVDQVGTMYKSTVLLCQDATIAEDS